MGSRAERIDPPAAALRGSLTEPLARVIDACDGMIDKRFLKSRTVRPLPPLDEPGGDLAEDKEDPLLPPRPR